MPVRLTFLFSLTGYIYLFKDDGMFGSKSIRKAGAGENLRNSLVFAWAFMETAAWFWVSSTAGLYDDRICFDIRQIFLSLRDERREQARRRIEKLQAEQDRL